jgi:hypothetical protein
MPTPRISASVTDEVIDAARRVMGLPADTPASQVIRAGMLRLAGQPDADGAPTDRGGRPKGYSPKRAREHATTP